MHAGKIGTPAHGVTFGVSQLSSLLRMAADTNNKLRFHKRHPTFVRVVLLSLTFLIALGVGAVYSTWALICRGNQCPSIESLAEYTPHQTSKLYAVDGRFIAELGLERRTLVKIDEIPKIVQEAFVSTEDKRFYQHAGIDWHRAASVVLRSPLHGYSQGFSTITMQLARNVFPEQISREKTIIRKVKEAKVAREIAAKYAKKRILELYLNQIALGHGASGVGTASQRYFGKSVRDLNLAEAATLAALPKAPARYNPVRFPERAIQRRNTVIELMRQNGRISDADASSATRSSASSCMSRGSRFTRRSTSTCRARPSGRWSTRCARSKPDASDRTLTRRMSITSLTARATRAAVPHPTSRAPSSRSTRAMARCAS